MINTVTFNGVNFWEELGAALSAPISYPIPAEIKELVKVKGANGSLTEATGYYNNLEIEAKFKVLIGHGSAPEAQEFRTLKRKINQLFNGIIDNRLSFEEIPFKYYKVKTAGVGAVTRISNFEATFDVNFICDPFLYSFDDAPFESSSHTIKLEYDGDVPNSPIIEVITKGQGEIRISCNNSSLTFNMNGGPIFYINKNPYSIVVNENGEPVKSNGGDIVLRKGADNTITVGGVGRDQVARVRIKKNERYLG